MKIYFTKFLPVEGEIKEGEYGLTSQGIVFKSLPTHMDLTKGRQKVNYSCFF